LGLGSALSSGDIFFRFCRGVFVGAFRKISRLLPWLALVALAAAPARAEPPALFNWSGFYAGINGGTMAYSTFGEFPAFPGDNFVTRRKETAFGGAHAGAQIEWNHILLGVEAAWDTNGNAIARTRGSNVFAVGCAVFALFNCESKIDDVFQIGPRVGLAFGQWLFYGTGGFTRATAQGRISDTPFSRNPGHHQDGQFYGGGIEFLATEHFVLGLEYKHFEFKKSLFEVVGAPVDNRTVQTNAEAILLRLSIR
jgi:opacity protein-like surface antigen